jgi:hypothetical protein
MQRMYGIDLKVSCNTKEVLLKLRENREKHATIVNEAREGYVTKAKIALAQRMEQLEKGKITNLTFSLTVPLNHTSAYDTVIKMLEMHSEPHITLSANEVSQFIEDKWEWSNQFIGSNAMYSRTAALMNNNDEE